MASARASLTRRESFLKSCGSPGEGTEPYADSSVNRTGTNLTSFPPISKATRSRGLRPSKRLTSTGIVTCPRWVIAETSSFILYSPLLCRFPMVLKGSLFFNIMKNLRRGGRTAIGRDACQCRAMGLIGRKVSPRPYCPGQGASAPGSPGRLAPQ